MKFSSKHFIFLGLGIFLIVGAYLILFQARKGVNEHSFSQDGLPLLLVSPEDIAHPAPGVLIAHGFAGNKQLMMAYAYTFAKAGYVCMLPDFVGHGANPAPMPAEGRESFLQDNLEIAYQSLISQKGVDASQIALLGHSMGSGAVLRYSLSHPGRFAATIAISPSARGVTVSDSLPNNLFLQAGEFEAPFVKTAKRLLAEAGGIDSNMAEGLGRDIRIIDGVEHISILFHSHSHHSALQWLDQTFGRDSQMNYSDHRIPWFWLHVLGWLFLLIGLEPFWRQLFPQEEVIRPRNKRRFLLAQLLAPILGVGVMVLIRLIFPGIAHLGGLLVGGGFALWIFISGAIWLGIGLRPQLPDRRDFLGAAILFTGFFLSYGWLAEQTWLPFFLNGPRLLKWIPLSLAFLPWFLGTAYLLQEMNGWKRLLWWFLQSVIVAGTAILLVMLVPDLRFLVLIIPVLPIVFGVCIIGGSVFRSPWQFALASALFLGWQVAMLFPLSG